MSTIAALTSAVIVLESCNILLFTLLLATPAPKHSMVKALILSCLLRSTIDIIPPIVHKVVPEQLGDNLKDYGGMISFCIAQSILLRYLTVVKAAFAVSFTLPCLSLALLQVKPKRSADDYPRLTRTHVVILCAAPFAWALPVLITPIPPIVRGQVQPESVAYNITSCYFNNTAFTVVSLIFTIIPLAIAVITVTIMGVIIWRFSGTMLDHTGWLFIKTKRFARFAGLVFATIISAALYTVLLSLWSHAHKTWPEHTNSGDWRSQHPVLTKVNRASVLWEAITPMLFFLIFAAQEEIYETWLGWLSLVVTHPRRKHEGCSADDSQLSQGVTQGARTSQMLQTHSTVIPQREQTTSSNFKRPLLSEKILALPLLSPFLSNGLNPPPRNEARVSCVPDEQPWTPSRFRIPFHGPSMTTFGSQFSTGSHHNNSSLGDLHSTEDGPSTTTEAQIEWMCMRPETPGSSTTFGRSGLQALGAIKL